MENVLCVLLQKWQLKFNNYKKTLTNLKDETRKHIYILKIKQWLISAQTKLYNLYNLILTGKSQFQHKLTSNLYNLYNS